MQRVFRLVDTADLEPVGTKATTGFERSVERHGILSPITVAEVVDRDGVITLEIVDGNRRVRAAKQARLEKIPAVVLKETTPEDRARLTLMSNHLRSNNFVTESHAVTELADTQSSARRAAHALGISATKLQNIFNKLENMPEPIRRAMYDDRIPVTSATTIAGWPPDLQDEIVGLLRNRRYLDSRVIEGVKKDYDARHTPPPRHAHVVGSEDWQAGTSWTAHEPVDVDDYSPTAPPRQESAHTTGDHTGGMRSGVPGSAAPQFTGRVDPETVTSEPEQSTQQVAGSPEDNGTGTPASGSDDAAGPMDGPGAFIARLDETLFALARETRANDLPRRVWIDRAMRAWDLSENG